MRKSFVMLLLLLPFSWFVICCGKEDDDNSNSSTSTVLTEDGYFDGILYYKITSNSPQEVMVSKADNNVSSINIPSSVRIDGATYAVTTIGKKAFYNCSRLTSVTISSNIISIGNYAFARCQGLSSIIIPDNVISIDEGVFSNCTNLSSVTISDNLICLGIRAFQGCNNLTTVALNSGLIGECAFSGCNNLESIHIKKVHSAPGIFDYIVYDIDNKYYYASGENYSGETGTGYGYFQRNGHKFNFNCFHENRNGIADNNIYSNATLYIPKDHYPSYLSGALGLFKNVIEE